MPSGFIWGIVVTLIVVAILRSGRKNKEGIGEFKAFVSRVRDFIVDFFSGGDATPAEPQSEPELEIEPPPVNFGNIRPVRGEERDLDVFGTEIHEFPDMKSPETRYEDFNRRLFILWTSADDYDSDSVWPNTTSDDYPTRITGMSTKRALEEIRLRLRPRYPVIYDTYGHWGEASRQLEYNPDFRDDLVDTYLAIPENQRPVVVSHVAAGSSGQFRYLRYGFEDFTLTVSDMRSHLRACLALVLKTLIGPREMWLWFSVARMRQTVIRAYQQTEAERRKTAAVISLERATIKAKQENEYKNRYLALWRNRIEFDVERAAPRALPEPDNETQPGETA